MPLSSTQARRPCGHAPDRRGVQHHSLWGGILRPLLVRGLGCGRGGLPCLLWTVNDPHLIRKYAADPRVAVIITDEAERALAIAGETTVRSG